MAWIRSECVSQSLTTRRLQEFEGNVPFERIAINVAGPFPLELQETIVIWQPWTIFLLEFVSVLDSGSAGKDCYGTVGSGSVRMPQ